MNKNIAYNTGQLARYFSSNRIAWDQFYESERVIIERLQLGEASAVLDVGCGCGGLGLALKERFGVSDYTGVEINSGAAEAARAMNPEARIHCGDILELAGGKLRGRSFDTVFSLSCIDWNVQFSEMLPVVWEFVRPGGYLVATFRLTEGEGCDDIARSYQPITYDGESADEQAAYVVLNARWLIEQLRVFDPSEINAYGYWGPPSSTAVTPFDRLCFAAVSVRKRASDYKGTLRCELDFPGEILANVGSLAL